MTTLFPRHCSDESLISHLDGELPFYSRGRVRRHLERCWQCRLRLSEIESQILEVTRAMDQDVFPGPQRIAEARVRFLMQADRVADEILAAGRSPGLVTAWRLAGATACLALLCAFLVWKLPRSTTPAIAMDTLKQVEFATAEAARVPSHQRFRVVARQLRPEAKIRESRLETWSEPGRGQYAGRFSDSRGVLQLAVWQPVPDRQYVYRASRSSEVVRISRRQFNEGWDGTLFREGLTLEDLEAGLMTWLENRPWRPVSLSYPAFALAGGDGAAVSVEESPAGARQGVVRLHARKSAGAITVEFILDVDRRTRLPELQSIRYESPARVLELQLYSEPAPAVTPVAFDPPGAMPGIPPAIPLARPLPEQPAAPVFDATLMEAEIYHALHRIRACLGETIEVIAEPDGTFEVRGAVVDEDRKDQVIAALAPLGGFRLRLQIKSAQELIREIPPGTLAQEGRPAPKVSHRTEAIQSLSRYFGGNQREAEEFADRVTSDGESLMKDAQALRQLAERFGGRTASLSRQGRWLVDVMSYDHLKDLESKAEFTRQLLLPVLEVPVSGVVIAPDSRWDMELLKVFDHATALNQRLRNLVLSGDPTQTEERRIREIREALLPLQSSIRAAADRALAAQAKRPD